MTPPAARPSFRKRAATRSQWANRTPVNSSPPPTARSNVFSLEMLFISRSGVTRRSSIPCAMPNTMDASFCVAALEEALARYDNRRSSTPTRAANSPARHSPACWSRPACASRWAGAHMDNVFIERVWRSLKHEDVYLKGYADGREANNRRRRMLRLLQRAPSSSGARLSRADGRLAPRRGTHRRTRISSRQNSWRLDKGQPADGLPIKPPPETVPLPRAASVKSEGVLTWRCHRFAPASLWRRR